MAFNLVWVLTCSKCSIKFYWQNSMKCRIIVTSKAVCEITSPVFEKASKYLSSSF